DVLFMLPSVWRHRGCCGLCVCAPDCRQSIRVVVSHVSFKRLSTDERAAYLASGEWEGKAGGYAIQGRAAGLVAWMSGSYSNIVGLPLFECRALLAGLGYPIGTV